jgi:hypothetical protein
MYFFAWLRHLSRFAAPQTAERVMRLKRGSVFSRITDKQWGLLLVAVPIAETTDKTRGKRSKGQGKIDGRKFKGAEMDGRK